MYEGAHREIRVTEGRRSHDFTVFMTNDEWKTFLQKYPEARVRRNNIQFVDDYYAPRYDYFLEYMICFLLVFLLTLGIYEALRL